MEIPNVVVYLNIVICKSPYIYTNFISNLAIKCNYKINDTDYVKFVVESSIKA